MNYEQARLAARRFVRWGDTSQLDELVANGYAMKVPKHLICMPGTCYRCDFKALGIIILMLIFRRKNN